MAKYLIEDIKVGLTGGGVACGPVPSSVVTEMKLRNTEDNSVMYYGITEVDGIENYLKSAESLYDFQIADDTSDEEGWNKVYAANIMDYDEEDPIWKLLHFFVRASWEEVDKVKPQCIGKYLEDIEVPVCDEEQDYLDDQEE